MIYFILIFVFPRGPYRIGEWLTRSRLEKDPLAKQEIDKLKKAQQDLELGKIKALIASDPVGDDEEAPSIVLRDKLYRAIKYMIGRHDWFEEQRFRIFQIILSVATASLSILGWTVESASDGHKPPIGSYWPLLATAAFAFLAAIHRYNRELDADRPYRSTADIRFWFFRYNMRDSKTFSDKPKPDLDKAERVILERKAFVERTIGSFSIEGSLREDVEQLFILQLLERAKSESLTLLRWLMSYTLLALLLQTVFYIAALSGKNVQ